MASFMSTLKIKKNSYKIGLDEIEGLKDVIKTLLKPVQDKIQDNIYWSKVELNETEYKSRDGFIAYTSNCGGIEIAEVLPKSEMYNFPYVDFGDCYEPNPEDMGHHECDEHCDAKLRVWFKFEGLDDNGSMKFYLYLGGGNRDAPYFRTKYEATYFESEFTAKSLADLKRKGKAQVNKLLKYMGK